MKLYLLYSVLVTCRFLTIILQERVSPSATSHLDIYNCPFLIILHSS